ERTVGSVVVDEHGGAVGEELDVHLGQEPVPGRGGEPLHGFLGIDVGSAAVGDRGREFEVADSRRCGEGTVVLGRGAESDGRPGALAGARPGPTAAETASTAGARMLNGRVCVGSAV